ncbi:uncharacterized protein [Macrobrachium rosenbergii]|uniref:uncharacterized protein n=1 Tax=Macrobrachium rosenbergii TaxID=79674 RepID=UPI0034D62774
MLISSVTVIALFVEATWAATSPIALDAFRQASVNDVASQIERQMGELLELFEVEWDLVNKDLESLPLSVDDSITQRFRSVKEASPSRDSQGKTNGAALEASGIVDKGQDRKTANVNGSFGDVPLGDSSVGGDDQHIEREESRPTTLSDLAEIPEAKERRERQAPPNAIYRRQQGRLRPCRSRDGTSSVFAGSNAMSYISFLANVMALVLNINNNVNNNNNNNNINSNNNIDNNNANLNVNSNNVNQVNIMPPGGKRRRRRGFDAKKSLATRSTCQPHEKGMVELVLDTTMKEAWRSLFTEAQVM